MLDLIFYIFAFWIISTFLFGLWMFHEEKDRYTIGELALAYVFSIAISLSLVLLFIALVVFLPIVVFANICEY